MANAKRRSAATRTLCQGFAECSAMEHHRVPPGGEGDGLGADARAVAPAEIDPERRAGRELAEAEVELRRPLPRVAGAAVHLRDQAAAIRKVDGRLGADRRAAGADPAVGRREAGLDLQLGAAVSG